MQLAQEGGLNLQQAKVHGWNIGKNKQAKKQLIAVLRIATTQQISLGHMFKWCTGAMNFTLLRFAPVATNVPTIFGWTQNLSGYQADYKPITRTTRYELPYSP